MPDEAALVDPRKLRYIPVAMWLLHHRNELSATARDAYGLLASLYNPAARGAWPRQSWMAEVLYVDRRTVLRALAELENLGLIERTNRGNRSSFYEFLDHPWMHEDEPSNATVLSPANATPGDTSNDNFSQTRSAPVLRTGRRALRSAAPSPDRRRIQAVADGDFGEVDAPALGADPDVPGIVEQTTRKRAKRQRPADPAAWNAMDLGEYFVVRCGKAATAGVPLMESFVGVGSAKVVAAHARKWMDAGVSPAQVKLDIDHFVTHYDAYRVRGAKPDKAFLAAASVIREKTMQRKRFSTGAVYAEDVVQQRSPYASA